MSPAIEGRFPWYIKLFGGRQSARSLHFLSLVAFLLFIIVHTALVLIVHFQDNIRNIVFGDPHANFGLALAIAVIALIIVAAIYVWATWYTLRHKRTANRFSSHVLHIACFDHLVCQQPHAPTLVSLRLFAAGERNQVGFMSSIEDALLGSWRLRTRSERILEPVLHKAFAHPLTRRYSHPKRLLNLYI